MLECEACGARFDAPTVHRLAEPMPDGYYESRVEAVCPYCGYPCDNDEWEE